METKREARNREYQLEDLCPLAEFCFIDYEKFKNCQGQKNYEQCLFYQEVMKCKEECLRKEVREKVLFHKLSEEDRKKVYLERAKYQEKLTGEKADEAQKSMPPLREEPIDL